MAMFETLVQLFAAFAKIGFTSFGGTSMIPLIMDEMSSHGWMTDADLTNLIAIAEMTPGSLGVNAATFAGTKTAGMPGGVFAVLGVLSPTLTLTLLAAVVAVAPSRGSLWRVGQIHSKRAKLNLLEAIVPCYSGQQQLDEITCPAAAAPASRARYFAPYSAFSSQYKAARPAKASPR